MVCLWISLFNDIIFESNKKQREKYWKKIRKILMYIKENGRLLLKVAYGISMHNLIHIASFNIQSMWLFTFTSSEFNSFSWNWKKKNHFCCCTNTNNLNDLMNLFEGAICTKLLFHQQKISYSNLFENLFMTLNIDIQIYSTRIYFVNANEAFCFDEEGKKYTILLHFYFCYI